MILISFLFFPGEIIEINQYRDKQTHTRTLVQPRKSNVPSFALSIFNLFQLKMGEKSERKKKENSDLN